MKTVYEAIKEYAAHQPNAKKYYRITFHVAMLGVHSYTNVSNLIIPQDNPESYGWIEFDCIERESYEEKKIVPKHVKVYAYLISSEEVL